MTAIEHFDLRSFDLNLLVAFDALYEERSVTGAALRLKVQQPAMSHSLATLRMLFQDKLFVRVGSSMVPTARADSLAPRIRRGLEQMQDAVHLTETFDPRVQKRTFRLAFSSEVELLLLPKLAGQLRSLAPNVKLISRPVQPDRIHQLLDDGSFDLGVGCFGPGASRHYSTMLFEQRLACCFNPSLLKLPTPIEEDVYRSTAHAIVTWTGAIHGCLDEALDGLGIRLNVVVAPSEFLSALSIAAETPVLLTLPARMAERYAPMFGLARSVVPINLQLLPVSMIWSNRAEGDMGSVWLREHVAAILSNEFDRDERKKGMDKAEFS